MHIFRHDWSSLCFQLLTTRKRVCLNNSWILINLLFSADHMMYLHPSHLFHQPHQPILPPREIWTTPAGWWVGFGPATILHLDPVWQILKISNPIENWVSVGLCLRGQHLDFSRTRILLVTLNPCSEHLEAHWAWLWAKILGWACSIFPSAYSLPLSSSHPHCSLLLPPSPLR